MEDPWTMLEQSITKVTTGQSEICMASPSVGFSKFPAIPVFPGSELIKAAENIAPTPTGPKCPKNQASLHVLMSGIIGFRSRMIGSLRSRNIRSNQPPS